MSQRKLISLAMIVLCAATALWAMPPLGQANLAAARRQFRYAQKMKATLEAELGGRRTELQYLKVIKAFRRVALITPNGVMVAPSMIEIGGLYGEMGHLFDTVYFQKAVDTYLYIVHHYPRAELAPAALYDAAELEQIELGDPALGRRFLRELVAKYPTSNQADRARLELASAPPPARQMRRSVRASAPSPAPSPAPARSEPAASPSGPPLTMGTVEGGVESPQLTLIRSVSYSRRPYGVRILIQLNGPVRFRSARITRPERVYFDLRRAFLIHPHGETLMPRSRLVTRIRVAQNQQDMVRVVLDIGPDTGYAASLLRYPYRLVIRVGQMDGPGRDSTAFQQPQASGRNGNGFGQTAVAALPKVGNLTPAHPLRSGEPSLVRALGLKVFRIVIDPGHGGFDTGAIGPNGLEEKNVTLSIALRLGRLIRERLPNTKVFYTRTTDVFVPLQERTRIANEDKADLFISIHANSSPDRAARGVETYYLDFTTSPQALAVAARENELSQLPVYKLRSLLEKISLNNKVVESHEFASDVENGIVHLLHRDRINIPDRGVGKAPFVVLIGAHMPSILVETSFISNPIGDRLLGEGSYREKIALGIFDGIRRYIASLNSLPSTVTTQADANRR